MFNLKKSGMALIFGLTFIAYSIGPVSTAGAVLLDTSSSIYLGVIESGEPSSPDNEALFINTLVALAPGGSSTVDLGLGPGTEPHTFIRSSNTLCYSPCPTATSTGSSSSGSNPSNLSIDVTGFTYLLAKYDGPNAGDLIWYVSGINGTVDILANWGPNPTGTQYGLSHYALFNGTPPRVPEPSTFLLLGVSLVALGMSSNRLGIKPRSNHD
jgi:PEP-CTERM motif